MIYIEEKDGMLYKYKVDIDYDRLEEVFSEIRKGNFIYHRLLKDGILKADDLDFCYADSIIESKIGERLYYHLTYYSKLYKYVSRLADFDGNIEALDKELYASGKRFDSNYVQILGLSNLLNYEGEGSLVSLIDEEIEGRKKLIDDGVYGRDSERKLKEASKIEELYYQREEAASLLDVSKLYESVMETISFEKVDEINKEEYLRDKGIFTLSKNQCLKIECGSYCKYEVTYNKDNMEEILNKLVKNSGFMNYEGIIISTNLECILRSILKERGDISSLLKYDSEKEEINIFRRKYAKRLKEIADNMGDDIDKIIDRLMSVKAEFPYSKFNTKLTVEPQAYYDEILSELRFKLIDSESVEEVKKAVEFDEGISEEVVKLSLTKK